MSDAPSRNAAQTARAALFTAKQDFESNSVKSQLRGCSGPAIAADCDLETLQAVLVVSNADAVACRAAAALQIMSQSPCDGAASSTCSSRLSKLSDSHADPHVAVAAALEAVQLLQEHLSYSDKAQANHDQECMAALRQQEAVLRVAEAKRQEADEARAQALAKQTTQSFKALGTGMKAWLKAIARSAVTRSKQIASTPQHSKLSANRVALPAGTYCSIAHGLLQLRLTREQRLYSTQLRELKLTSVDQNSKPPQERACGAAERLSNLCCMMRQRVAPYNLAMSDSELVLTFLHSLPWLAHSRTEAQQLEEVEVKLLLQEVAQYELCISKLTGRERQAAVVAMSRRARMQLLLAHSRHILAASNVKNSSSLWRGVSWALFPKGIERDLQQSDPDMWHSCSRVGAPALTKAPQLQLRADSPAASYLQELRTYPQSSYPSFDQLLCEELRSSISAQNMPHRRLVAASEPGKPPAAAMG